MRTYRSEERRVVDRLDEYRQNALDELASRYASGRIADAQFEEAVARIGDSETEDELVAALTSYKLPVPYDLSTPESVPADPGQSVAAILTERTLNGNWIRHRYVTATTVMGALTIDLRDVELTQDTRLHIIAVMGEVKIILPGHIRVRNEISALLAEHTDHGGPRLAARNNTGPELLLSGFAILAEVTVL